MKKSRIYLLLALFAAFGFVLGLSFDSMVGKAYAKTETPDQNISFPQDPSMVNESFGMARSANYEIVTIYGRKYIIFSSGSDIEVLEYN